MTPEQLLADIRERLVRIEERAAARDERIQRVEESVATLDRFRWWILGGLGVAGGVGGAVAQNLPTIFH